MHSHRAWCVFLTTVLICAWGPAVSAQGQEPKAVRVQLTVSADPDLKVLVQKPLEEELRKLPGVSVTDAFPEYTISVIALSVVNQSRRNVGATFSVLVTELCEGRVRKFSELNLPPELSAQLTALLSGAVKPVSHWVETAAADDIPAVCRSIIRSFHEAVLRRGRELTAFP